MWDQVHWSVSNFSGLRFGQRAQYDPTSDFLRNVLCSSFPGYIVEQCFSSILVVNHRFSWAHLLCTQGFKDGARWLGSSSLNCSCSSLSFCSLNGRTVFFLLFLHNTSGIFCTVVDAPFPSLSGVPLVVLVHLNLLFCVKMILALQDFADDAFFRSVGRCESYSSAMSEPHGVFLVRFHVPDITRTIS